MDLVHTETIGQHFMPALHNDDHTGLSDDDSKQLIDWERSLTAEIGVFTLQEKSYETDFALCEITGLMSDCIEIEIYA